MTRPSSFWQYTSIQISNGGKPVMVVHEDHMWDWRDDEQGMNKIKNLDRQSERRPESIARRGPDDNRDSILIIVRSALKVKSDSRELKISVTARAAYSMQVVVGCYEAQLKGYTIYRLMVAKHLRGEKRAISCLDSSCRNSNAQGRF